MSAAYPPETAPDDCEDICLHPPAVFAARALFGQPADWRRGESVITITRHHELDDHIANALERSAEPLTHQIIVQAHPYRVRTLCVESPSGPFVALVDAYTFVMLCLAGGEHAAFNARDDRARHDRRRVRRLYRQFGERCPG